MGRAGRVWGLVGAAALTGAACGSGAGTGTTTRAAPVGAAGPGVTAVAAATLPTTAAPTTVAPTTTPPAPAPPAAARPTASSATTRPSTTTAPTPPPPPPPPRIRAVTEQAWLPFASVQGVTLSHPSARVERVGFHESNHDGARELDPLATAVAPVILEGRERGTSARSAADVVVDPAMTIRSVVTGRVKRAGSYVLYCRYSDHYLVIAPDGHPDWEVKMLHIGPLQVRTGDRVVAGETVVATGPTQLPFESQVDELASADPPWPHVHIEVVDPSIPDRPSPGGGCS